jgi:hypothetical protein
VQCSKVLTWETPPTKSGDRVAFARENIFLPNPENVTAFDAGCEEFEGTIIDFSDGGNRVKAYAVVEVVRRLSLVVPVECLRIVTVPGREGG